MVHSTKSSFGISAYVKEFTLLEMQHVNHAKSEIKKILDNHAQNAVPKLYLNDEGLKDLYAILSVLTKEYDEKEVDEFEEYFNSNMEDTNEEKQTETV